MKFIVEVTHRMVIDVEDQRSDTDYDGSVMRRAASDGVQDAFRGERDQPQSGISVRDKEICAIKVTRA